MNEAAGAECAGRARGVLALVVTVGLVVTAAAASAAGAVSPTPALAIEEAGDVEQEIPAEVGRSIGSPDAGPDPQHSGDRGGWAQLLTLGVLSAGVGFIMWRIIGAARQAPGSSASSSNIEGSS